LTKLPDSPSRFDAFFGAEEDYTSPVSQTILGQSVNLPVHLENIRPEEKVWQRSDPSIVLPVSGNSLGNVTDIFTDSILDQPPMPIPPLPQMSKSDSQLFGHLPSPSAPIADKYGALADLFSNPDPIGVSSFLTSPISPLSDHDAKVPSDIVGDLFSIPNPEPTVDPDEKEEDFGDFIAVTRDNQPEAVSFPLPVPDDFRVGNSQDQFAELSGLNFSSNSQGQVSSMPSIFPSSVNTRVIPWFESSPPPLPPGIKSMIQVFIMS
jgi:hypothetical protein